MANIRALATIGFLVTLGSGPSIAMSPQEVPGTIASCKAITDDKERLKCFDDLFGRLSKPEKSQEGDQGNWAVDETGFLCRVLQRRVFRASSRRQTSNADVNRKLFSSSTTHRPNSRQNSSSSRRCAIVASTDIAGEPCCISARFVLV